jgi:predicted ester cyclase
MPMPRIVLGLLLVFATVDPSAGQTPATDHETVFLAMVRAINDRDLDALDALIAPDVVRHSQATPDVEVRSLGDFKDFLRTDFATVPDSEVDCPMVIVEGDLLASWCTYRGTQQGAMGPFPPTGRRLDLDFSGFMRFEEGRIAEIWVTWDNLTALGQLGHFPPPGADEGGQTTGH